MNTQVIWITRAKIILITRTNPHPPRRRHFFPSLVDLRQWRRLPPAFVLAAVIGAPAAGENNLQLPEFLRSHCRNRTSPGSCVQYSISGAGMSTAHRAAATLPWDSEHGRAIHGGSGPSRVRKYATQREIPIWNITGKTTIQWCQWAVDTHRVAGLGFGSNHFQLLVGKDGKNWIVMDNNPPGPKRFQVYTDRQFRKMHAASGHWVVILARPPPLKSPVYRKWYNEK